MKEPWDVITEIPLINQADRWGSDPRRQLFAIQVRFREDGPDAYALDPMELANVPAWDQLEEPCTLDFWVQLRGRIWRFEIEIRPGRTIIFRRVRRE